MATARVPLSSPAQLPAGRRHLFMAGLLLALAAFVATFLLGSFMVLRSQQIVGGQSIAVASRDIQAREELNSDAVSLVSYPSNLVPSTALTGMNQVNHQFATRAIAKGEVVTTAMVSAQPVKVTESAQAFLPIPAGSVAFTIPTSEMEGVAGYIAPGDYVDVIATVDQGMFPGGHVGKIVAKTIFTNLYVVRVGPQVAPAEGRPGGVSSSLTVIINSCDAEMWSWLLQTKLAQNGNYAILRYELLSYHDYPPAPVPTTGSDTSASPSPAASPAATSAGSTGSASSSQTGTATTTNFCPLGGTTGIGAAQVEARFGFTRI